MIRLNLNDIEEVNLMEELLEHGLIILSSDKKLTLDEFKAINNRLGKPLINKKYTLDGDFSWNTAGLINHSCNPNSRYDGKGLKIWITALKNIKKGEEFTCDYGFGFDSDYKQFPCKCGEKNCCGYIVREESRWRINKKFAMSNKKKLINNSRYK